MHWESKNHVTHFIAINICFLAAVWSQICHVSQVCLILKISLHCLCAYVVFDKESSISFMILLLYVLFFKTLSLVLSNLIMCLHVTFIKFLVLGICWASLICWFIAFAIFEQFGAILPSDTFLSSPSFPLKIPNFKNFLNFGVIFDYTEAVKVVQRIDIHASLHFSIKILYTVVPLSKLRNQHWHITINQTLVTYYLNSISSSIHAHFLFQDPIHNTSLLLFGISS